MLKYLDFSLRPYNINGIQSNSTPTFSSQLDQVCITTPSPSVLTHCLRNVRFFSCQSVNLYIDTDDLEIPYGPLDIPDLVASSKCFSPALETLHFDFDIDLSILFSMELLANPSYAPGFDVVAPLLSFGRLKNLQPSWISTSAIDDASLKTMANPYLNSRLPRLELRLICWSAISHFHRTRPPHTLLSALAQH